MAVLKFRGDGISSGVLPLMFNDGGVGSAAA